MNKRVDMALRYQRTNGTVHETQRRILNWIGPGFVWISGSSSRSQYATLRLLMRRPMSKIENGCSCYDAPCQEF